MNNNNIKEVAFGNFRGNLFLIYLRFSAFLQNTQIQTIIYLQK